MVRTVFQLVVLSATAGVLTACLGLTENKFERKVAKAQCELYERCQPTDFDAEYDSIGDCTKAVDGSSETDLDYYDDCDYVRDEAKDCLKAIEGLPCEAEEADYVDFNNSCFNVWICEGAPLPGDDDDDEEETTDSR